MMFSWRQLIQEYSRVFYLVRDIRMEGYFDNDKFPIYYDIVTMINYRASTYFEHALTHIINK